MRIEWWIVVEVIAVTTLLSTKKELKLNNSLLLRSVFGVSAIAAVIAGVVLFVVVVGPTTAYPGRVTIVLATVIGVILIATALWLRWLKKHANERPRR